MISAPNPTLTAAIRRFAEFRQEPASERCIHFNAGNETVALPSFRFGSKRYVLVGSDGAEGLASVSQLFQQHPFWRDTREEGITHYLILAAGENASPAQHPEPRGIDLGVTVTSLWHGISEIAGLPDGWLDRQNEITSQILHQSMPHAGTHDTRLAQLWIPSADNANPVAALPWLKDQLAHGAAAGTLVYIRAEAGKGKSTLFAQLSIELQRENSGPLALMVPLRNLGRHAGASWPAICASIGVVGGAVQRLADATRAGLLILLLDGLDEISGRYDPSVVEQVMWSLRDTALQSHSLIAISGRTTEGRLLREHTVQRTLELPEPQDPEFRAYARTTIVSTAPQWADLAAHIPTDERILASGALVDRQLTDADASHLLDWLLYNFVDFGKDRSLFFVQSLACLGRDMQLRGNQPIFVRVPNGAPHVRLTGIYDACLCAAWLACIREQNKIQPEAQGCFLPSHQLDIVTIFALMACTDDARRARLPTPNAAIADCCELDAINQTEELTAVTRQMQKHALLYATGGVGAGDWRPAFLSKWILNALLVRAWCNASRIGAAMAAGVRECVANAQNADYAFRYILPDLLPRMPPDSTQDIANTLTIESNAGSPEATRNFWLFFQGLRDESRAALPARPGHLREYADFSEVEFDGVTFGAEFSGNIIWFAEARFTDCVFEDCVFSSCDFTDAVFSNCKFVNVRFEYCDGPMYFEDCHEITGTLFREIKSKELPGWTFTRCRFTGQSALVQEDLPNPTLYGPIATFHECVCDGPHESFLQGPELGMVAGRPLGLSTEGSDLSDPALECLRRLLSRFFPPRAGTPGSRQARDYIRSSSIARGCYPAGSPSPDDLTGFLRAEGFTNGGRQAHLYAPWSEVVGHTRNDLRAECASFLRDPESRGPTISRLLARIRTAGRWQ